MRRPKRSAWLLGAAAFGLLALAPSPALAFGGGFHAGAKGGLAMQSDGAIPQNEKDLGWALGGHGAYGLSDMFDLELELLWARNASGLGKTDVLAATGGIAYKIDILRWIPYFGVLGGYYHWGGAPGPNGESGSAVGASAQIGLDFLATRELAFNLDFRWHFSFKDEFYAPLRTLMLGAEYRWDL